MTKIYIGAGPAFYGLFDHLFLVKAPNDDLTSNTNTHKLIEAVPSGDVFGDPPFGNLVVVNNGDYEDSENRLDQNRDGDITDPGDFSLIDKGMVEVTIAGDKDDAWDRMVAYVETLSITADPDLIVDTGYQYYGITNANSNSVAVSLLSVLGYDVYGNLPTTASLSSLSIPGYQYLLDGTGDTGVGTDYSGLQGFNYDVDNVILKRGGSDTFFGGASSNDIRFDESDGVDQVRYNGTSTGTLSVTDDVRTVSGVDNQEVGFTDTLYSIEKGSFEVFSASNNLDYSGYGQAISVESYSLFERLANSATTGVEVTEDTGQIFKAENIGKIIGTDYDDTIDISNGWFSGQPVVVDGGDGIDTINGSTESDDLSGGDGEDIISSGGGNDLIDGGAGDDEYHLGGGNSYITPGQNGDDDTVYLDWSNATTGIIYIAGNGDSCTDWVISGVDDVEDFYLGVYQGGLALFQEQAGHADRIFGVMTDYFVNGGGFCGVSITDLEENTKTFDLSDPADLDLSGPRIRGDFYINGVAADVGSTSGQLFDPLVLDLDGDTNSDGHDVELTTGTNRTLFDLNGDGFAENVSWVDPDDGILARDVNENGWIDDGTELFGTATINGFDALAAFDDNEDGFITSADDIWADLLIWKDASFDAHSNPGELHSLASLSITSIAVTGYSTVNANVGDGVITHEGTYTRSGSAHEIVNAQLSVSTTSTVYAGAYTLDPETIFLPNIKGYGTVADLNIAMSLDNTGGGNLLEMVQDFVAAYQTTLDVVLNYANLRDDVADILYRWADVESVDPGSRGDYLEDARHLAFLEKLTGTAFLDVHLNSSDPGLVQAQLLEETWQTHVDRIAGQLLAQHLGAGFFDMDMRYDLFTDSTVSGTLALNQDTLDALTEYAEGLANTAARQAFWLDYTGTLEVLLTGIGKLLSNVDDTQLGNAIEASDATLTWRQEDHNDGGVKSIEYRYYYGTEDIVEGDGSGNTLSGGSADEIMVGGLGADTLSGNGGADTLYGHTQDGGSDDNAADTLNGGAGNDLLFGGGGNDILNGNADNDSIYGGAGNDTLNGSTGADQLYGGDGNDTLIEGFGSGQQEIADGGAGDDTYYMESAYQVFVVDSAGIDTLGFYDSGVEKKFTLANMGFEIFLNDNIRLTNSTQAWDVLLGDQLTALNDSDGAGVEYLRLFDGTGGGANLVVLDLKDYLLNYSGSISSYGGSLGDTLTGSILGGGDETVWARGGADTVNSGSGVDIVHGEGGNDSLYGEDGDDTVYGEDGDDYIDGGSGHDTLDGGSGTDTFFLSAGHDVVIDATGSGLTVAMPEGVEFGDISFYWQVVGTGVNKTNSLVLSLDVDYDITLEDWFASGGNSGTTSYVKLSDGTITAFGTTTFDNPFQVVGTESDDDMSSTVALSINEWIDGKGGDDILKGGSGDDTFVAGLGLDTISSGGSGTDRILFGTGLTPSDIRYVVSNTFNAKVIIDANTNEIVVTSQNELGRTVESIEFQDGYVLDFYNFKDWVRGSGTGSQSLTGDGTSNTIAGNGGDGDVLSGQGGNDVLIGFTGADTLQGDAGNDTLYAGAGNDTLDGGANNDTLYGEAGNDTLSGGSGTDVINGGSGTDTVDYSAAAGAVTVSLASGTASNDGDSGTDTITNVENVTGSANADSITGDSSANTLSGGGGNDTLVGKGGNDTLDGGSNTDTADYSAAAGAVTVSLASGTASNDGDGGSDTLSNIENITGSANADSITGNSSANMLSGNDGNDTLAGKGGNDTIDGGNGTDVVDYSAAAAAVTVSLTSGTASNDGDGGSDTITNVENVTGSAYADAITGSSAANVLSGGTGNDTIAGRGGNDTIDGGSGTDAVDYSAAAAAVTVSLAFGSASNDGDGGSNTFTNIEDAIGSAYNDTITGSTGNNTLAGKAGNDAIDGGSGADTVSYSAAAAAVTVNLASGTASNDGDGGNDTLTSIENVIGSAYNDTITGSTGNNTLAGRAGNDTIDGGSGTDTVDYSAAAGSVTVSLTSGTASNDGDSGSDTLSNIENVTGSANADTITGSSSANVLFGGAGNDTISGSGGADTLIGGAGNDSLDGGSSTDIVSYIYAASGVTLSLASGSASNDGDGGSDTLTGFEDVIGSDFNDTLTGSSAQNEIYGGAGNDTIDGGSGGADILYGEGGNDTITSNTASNATLDGGDGDDILYGYTGNDTLRGQAGDDLIYGGAGNDTINGYDGSDELHGGDGNDTINGGGDSDALYGDAGDDDLTGGTDNDVIYGGAHDDDIDASAGNDFIYGGDGLDTITGRTSANQYDVYVFESASAFNDVDVITSWFSTDILDLSQLLTAYDPGTDDIDDFINIHVSGSDTLIGVDADGGGNSFVDIVRIQGTTSLGSAESLIASRNLVVDGENIVLGTDDVDSLNGTSGVDLIFGDGSSDLVYAGSGNDYIDAGGTIYGEGGNDIIVAGSLVYGGDGDDTITAVTALGGMATTQSPGPAIQQIPLTAMMAMIF